MRELKFRAWDGERKQMYTNPKWVEFVVDKNGVLSAQNFNRAGSVQQLVVMQYTGLKDRKGVEIYEGDLVYLAGYGDYTAAFPFIELYEAAAEMDIGCILGNIHEDPELLGATC